MLVGVGLFLVGSLLCGPAWNMLSLIAFRAIQGLGAGAVHADRHDDRRGHLLGRRAGQGQGYLASVWAIAAVVGPTLGGVFADYLSWRWIFLVNLPIGGRGAVMLSRGSTRRSTGRGTGSTCSAPCC